MRKPRVYCEVVEKHNGGLDFYLSADGTDYFLFNQNYRSTLESFFKDGVDLNRALDRTGLNKDTCVRKVITKLPAYIRYIEKEYDILVLRRSTYA